MTDKFKELIELVWAVSVTIKSLIWLTLNVFNSSLIFLLTEPVTLDDIKTEAVRYSVIMPFMKKILLLSRNPATTDEDIIKDRKIAGTGTISYDGTVGEIDGIKYKIMGAAKDNVKIVFVPTANYEEAIMTKNKYKYDLEIVRVDNFKEAIEYLKK